MKGRLIRVSTIMNEQPTANDNEDDDPILVQLDNRQHFLRAFADDSFQAHCMGSETYILPLFLSFFWSEGMTIAEAISYPEAFEESGTLHALLVEKLPSNVFIRRGCVEPYIAESESSSYRQLLQAWDSRSEETITLV